jgi:hypothetical protein
MRRAFVSGAALCILTLAASPSWADVIAIAPNRDVTIFQNPVNNSSGLDNSLFVGATGMASPRRALMGFDIAGNLPAGAVVQSVSLKLVLGLSAGSSSPTIDLFRVTSNWNEGTAQTPSIPPDSVSGQGSGVAATTGDATWNARMFNTANWTTAGGDFATPSSASLQIVGTTVGTSYIWNSTALLVSDVQSWLDSPATNFGWILVNQSETTSQTAKVFYSRNTATATLRPELTIAYAVPEPSTIWLAVLGVAWILAAKRAA